MSIVKFSEILPDFRRESFSPPRIILAGPTCGKTTFVNANNGPGWGPIIDMDEIKDFVAPEWHARRLWKLDGKNEFREPYVRLLWHSCAMFSRLLLEANPDAILLSNEMGSTFMNILDQALGRRVRALTKGQRKDGVLSSKCQYVFFRSEPEVIVDLSRRRGDEIPLRLAKKWVDSVKQGYSDYAETLVLMSADDYLSQLGENTSRKGGQRAHSGKRTLELLNEIATSFNPILTSLTYRV